MRIAIFVPFWPAGKTPNGIVTYASYLVPALRQLGHEVFVLTFARAPDEADPYTIDLSRFLSNRTWWDRLLFRLAPAKTAFGRATSAITSAVCDLVTKNRIEVLEIEESFGWSMVVSTLGVLPVVVRLHGPWFLNGAFNEPDDRILLNRGRTRREGIAIQHADYVTSPSELVLREVRNHYGVVLTRSRVLSNPIDAVDEAKIWDVNSCSIDSLLFVGRFDRRKGGDLVLRAFADLAKCYPKLRLTFVGPDRRIDTADGIQTFEQYVRANCAAQLRSRIDFCGPMNYSKVMALRPKHFVTIVASQYEIMPYSVLEPMSFGCPLVATNVGGIPEVIKHRRNGLLVPSQNVEAIASACKQLLDDRRFAARIGRQAWQDCRGLLGSEEIARQTVDVYKEAIDGNKLRSKAGDGCFRSAVASSSAELDL